MTEKAKMKQEKILRILRKIIQCQLCENRPRIFGRTDMLCDTCCDVTRRVLQILEMSYGPDSRISDVHEDFKKRPRRYHDENPPSFSVGLVIKGGIHDDFIKNGVTGEEVQYWMTSCKVTIPQLAKYMNITSEEIEKARENGLPGNTCLTWMNAIIET